MKPLFANILVAVNGSEASINAAKYGILLCKTYRCEMTAVYVVDTATLRQLLISRIFIEEESREYQENLEASGKRYLNYVEELARQKGVGLRTELRQGAIYTEVLKAADEQDADLILLGGWEASRNDKDIVSLAHREILQHARRSVLVVKEPDIDFLFKKM